MLCWFGLVLINSAQSETQCLLNPKTVAISEGSKWKVTIFPVLNATFQWTPDLQYTSGSRIIVHKLMPGLQYTPGSCRKGVANGPSGSTRAMVSCKRLSYAIAKMLQVVEKLSKESIKRQFKVEAKKIRYWIQQVTCLVENKKQRGSCKRRDLMDQLRMTRYGRFVRSMAFYYVCLYAICVQTSYDGDQKKMNN